MTSKILTKNKTDTELADEAIRALYCLPTAKEAYEHAQRLYDSAWRDKIHVEPCQPDRPCEAPSCPCCRRRNILMEVIEDLRWTNAVRGAGRKQRQKLSLSDADDAELTDELLNVAWGIPTRAEVQRRAKNVYRQARRMGLNVGQECKCTGHQRMNCAACRRSQQLATIVAFLAACDVSLCWRTITIIPEYGRSELRAQPLGDVRKVVRRVIDTLQECAPRITGLFVLEPSVNTDLKGVENCQWHVHGIFRRVKKSEYLAIKEAFNWSDASCRAVHSQKVNDVVGHLAYITKPEVFSRKRYVQSGGMPSISKYPVRTRQEALIADALGAKRIGSRVFCVNMGEVEEMLR